MNFKLIAIFVAFVLMALASGTFAQQEESSGDAPKLTVSQVKRQRETPVPQPRITCDILGSDAYCAVHCIAKGYRGGYCNSQKVCVCR